MGDALAVIPLMAFVLVLGYVTIVLLAAAEGFDLTDLSDDSVVIPGSLIVIPTLIQQAAWATWPFVVSRWKGLGPAEDWGWAFRWSDLGIGVGTAMIGMFAAGITAVVVSALVGLEDPATTENTSVVSDLEGSPWLWGILVAVVIGAPISEELLFRGLILRTVAKRWGVVAGVVVSQLAFVPIHLADGGGFGAGQIVLWASVSSLGLVLAVCAVQTGRLGAPIVAHALVNLFGAVGALDIWQEFQDLPILPG